MATIVTPTSFATEERMEVPLSGVRCLVISGYAKSVIADPNVHNGPVPMPTALTGDEDEDEKWVDWTLHMVVGPTWRAVRDVSPSVTVAGFSFNDSDEADDSGYHIDSCTWDTVGLSEGSQDLERIRLKVELRVRGGKGFGITQLAYQLTAVGR